MCIRDRTLGEWLGTWVAIVGFVFSLLTTIILGGEGAYLSQGLGLWFLNISAISIILMPIYGFLIVISARVFAEALRALVSIANNTIVLPCHMWARRVKIVA